MKPLRLCVVGCGVWAGRMHHAPLRALVDAGRIACVGVCDLDRARANQTRSVLDAEAVFADAAEMLDRATPDGVVLLVSTAAMPGMIELAAGRRIPFLCEKPPATDTDAHRRLIDAVGDLPHLVAYNRRHAPCVRDAADWLSGHAIQLVTAAFCRHRRLDPDFSTTAVHAIDAVRVLAGGRFAELRIVVASAGDVRNFYIDGFAAGGARVSLQITPNVGRKSEHYTLHAADRSAGVSFPHPNTDYGDWLVELIERDRVARRITAADYGVAADDWPVLAGIAAEHEAFTAILSGGAPAASTLTDCLQTQQVRAKLRDLAGGGEATLTF